jgi:hypothetical protein
MADLNEPVWYEDVQDQEEQITDSWKQVYNFVEKLRHQGAPEELVHSVILVNDMLGTAVKELQRIKVSFPMEPKR